MRGNCYVACEALYHLLGGKQAGYVPHTLKTETDNHWYLVHKPTGLIVDPTVSQFTEAPDYSKGRGRGFLTRDPSRRARELMRQMVWQ